MHITQRRAPAHEHCRLCNAHSFCLVLQFSPSPSPLQVLFICPVFYDSHHALHFSFLTHIVASFPCVLVFCFCPHRVEAMWAGGPTVLCFFVLFFSSLVVTSSHVVFLSRVCPPLLDLLFWVSVCAGVLNGFWSSPSLLFSVLSFIPPFVIKCLNKHVGIHIRGIHCLLIEGFLDASVFLFKDLKWGIMSAVLKRLLFVKCDEQYSFLAFINLR